MNYFLKAFVSSVMLCVVTLAAVYFFAKRKQQSRPPQEVLWHESLTQLKELSRHKHRQSLHYIAYAHYAERDSLHALAALMNAISHADAVQCDNCRQAISSLGGEYSSPTTLPTHFTNHADHIAYALRDKNYTHSTLFPPAIEQALEDNNRFVARMLTWCHASDTKQIFLLQQFLYQEVTHARFRVCPVCGNISWEAISPRHCPHCMTDSIRFVVFAFPKIQ